LAVDHQALKEFIPAVRFKQLYEDNIHTDKACSPLFRKTVEEAVIIKREELPSLSTNPTVTWSFPTPQMAETVKKIEPEIIDVPSVLGYLKLTAPINGNVPIKKILPPRSNVNVTLDKQPEATVMPLDLTQCLVPTCSKRLSSPSGVKKHLVTHFADLIATRVNLAPNATSCPQCCFKGKYR